MILGAGAEKGGGVAKSTQIHPQEINTATAADCTSPLMSDQGHFVEKALGLAVALTVEGSWLGSWVQKTPGAAQLAFVILR